MYASIIQCDMHAIDSFHERERVGRSLATHLSTLPGFVAFVALDDDADSGKVAALCIFDDCAGMRAADHAVEQWARAQVAIRASIQRLTTGAVIAQKGL